MQTERLIIDQSGTVFIDGQNTRIKVKQTKDGTQARYVHPLGWSEPVKLDQPRYSLKHDGSDAAEFSTAPNPRAGRQKFLHDILFLIGVSKDGKLAVETATPYYRPHPIKADSWELVWAATSGAYPADVATHLSALVARHYSGDPSSMPALIEKMGKRMELNDAQIEAIAVAVMRSIARGQAIHSAANPG